MNDQNLSQKLDQLTDLLRWLPKEICNVLDEREDVRNEKVFQDLNQSMEKFTQGFSYKPPKKSE